MMRRNHPSLLILLVVLAFACEERSEGCLDPKSNDFDVTVRDECCCCCEYPVLKLTFSHQYGDGLLQLGQDYVNSHGQSFQVVSFQHFISDVQVNDESRWSGILDSLTVFTPDDGLTVLIDDPIRVLPSQFSYDVGTFLTDGNFNQLRFQTGIDPPATYYQDEDAETEHPLQQFSSDLYDESLGYLDFSFTLRGPQGDTLVIQRLAEVAGTTHVLDVTSAKEKGDDLTVLMQIDYQSWLADIDFATDGFDQMARKISAGQTGSFVFVP